MSPENVETIREMFAILNDRGVKAATEAFGGLLAPDFGLEEGADLPDPEAYTGRESFIENMAKLEESFEELRMERLEIVDLGEKVIVVVSKSGRGQGSSVPVEMTFAQLWLLRDGKAVSLPSHSPPTTARWVVYRTTGGKPPDGGSWTLEPDVAERFDRIISSRAARS